MRPHMQRYLFMHLWTHFHSAHVLHPYTEVSFLVSLHLCLHSHAEFPPGFQIVENCSQNSLGTK